jgi:hypothetical protein
MLATRLPSLTGKQPNCQRAAISALASRRDIDCLAFGRRTPAFSTEAVRRRLLSGSMHRHRADLHISRTWQAPPLARGNTPFAFV